MPRSIRLALLALAAPAVAGAQPTSSAAPTTFTIRIENVSTATTLRPSTGGGAPAPVSPGVWAVHGDAEPLFTIGLPDRGAGLEALAEDGNPAPLAAALRAAPRVRDAGAFTTPVGAAGPAPLLPGQTFELTVSARAGERLSLASMFGQSNDLFYAVEPRGIPLFDAGGAPLRGELTARLVLYDAGTEVNEEPGAGPNQGPRQSAWNVGPAEHGVVRPVLDGFTYPATAGVLRLTISPASVSAAR